MSEVLSEKGQLICPKRNVWKASAYLLLAILSVLSIFAAFWSVLRLSVVTSPMQIEYNFANMISNFTGGEQRAAVGAVTMFAIGAVVSLLFAVLDFGQVLSKKAPNKIVRLVKLIAAIVFAVVFSSAFGGMISLQFSLLRLMTGNASITVFFVLNILVPISLLSLLIAEFACESAKSSARPMNIGKLYPTSFLYPVLMVLSLVTLASPLYTFVLTVGELTSSQSYLLSHFVSDLLPISLLNARTTSILTFSVLISVLMMSVNFVLEKARVNADQKTFNIAKTFRLVFGLGYLAWFVLCIFSVVDFHTLLNVQIGEMSGELISNVQKSIGFWLTLIVPVLTALVVGADCVNGYTHWNERLVVIAKKKADERPSQVHIVMKAIYSMIALLLLLSLAVPYGTLTDWANVDTKIFMYIVDFKWVSYFQTTQGSQTPVLLFSYILLAMAIVALSLTLPMIVKSMRLSEKKREVCGLIAKAIPAVTFTIVFIIMHKYLALYDAAMFNTAAVTELTVNQTAVNVFVAVAMIGLLATVWLDVLMKVLKKFKK